MAHRTTAILSIAAVLALTASASAGQSCPEPLRDARRLVLVTAGGMATSAATMRLFHRASPNDRWQQVGGTAPARIGRAGMAWGHPFLGLKRDGEPVKLEGDKRAPAGIYRIGRSFGFTASHRRNHLRLTRQSVCVDDAGSPAYNTITSRRRIGAKVHAERMGTNANYRQGLVVDYPTNAAARAGSCIFIHVWRSPDRPTAGCVALSEARVKALQDFAAPSAVLAILPAEALRRLPGCLPAGAEALN